MYNVNTTSQHWWSAAPPQRYSHVNLQPLTRPRRARLAGAGAARSSARLRVHDENDVRVWGLRQVSFLPNNNQKLIENENYKRTSHSCWWVFVRHRRDHRQSQELHPGTIDTLQLCFIILRQLNFRLNTIPQRRGGPGYGRVKVWGNALTYCIIIMRHDVLIFCCQYWNFSVW